MNMVEERCDKCVSDCIGQYDFTHLKNIIAVNAPKNFGKTTILKMVIEKLYDIDPNSWLGRSAVRNNGFRRSRVTNYAEANRLSAEYSGVFNCSGVIVSIHTAGDYVPYIVKSFRLFAESKASVGIMAVRKGNIAEVAYGQFKNRLTFKETAIDLPVKYNGAKWTNDEQGVADQIVQTVEAIVTKLNKNER